MEIIKLNALKAIARQCNDELKKYAKRDKRGKVTYDHNEIRPITMKYSERARLLGFKHSQLLIEIGTINGVIKEA